MVLFVVFGQKYCFIAQLNENASNKIKMFVKQWIYIGKICNETTTVQKILASNETDFLHKIFKILSHSKIIKYLKSVNNYKFNCFNG